MLPDGHPWPPSAPRAAPERTASRIMCGIAGEITFDGSRPDIALVAAITETLSPRGPDCVHRLYGMFAFCLWEQQAQRAHLVRDRLGIKPLYYQRSDRLLRFASSLPALLEATAT
jgi:asparagine synthetase B (glutamine-hydrolysing)